MDQDEISIREQLATLRTAGRFMSGQIANLQADVNAKHKENRDSIHEMRNHQQVLIDMIHAIELKLARMAGYAIGAGAATGTAVAIIAHIIDILWKK